MAAAARGSVATYFLIVCLLQLAPRVTAATKGLDRTFAEIKRCADEECSMLMCRGKALQDFTGPDCRFVSLKKGETVYVYYKLSGKTDRVWAGSVGSEFGYFPKELIEINHIYSTVDMEVPADETDFVCFSGGEDNFDNYNVNDLLNIPDVQEDSSVLHSEPVEIKRESSESTEHTSEQDAKVNLEDSEMKVTKMDLELLTKDGRASAIEQDVDTRETTASMEETSQSSAHEESNSYQEVDKNNTFRSAEDSSYSQADSVSTHPTETSGHLPESIHGKDASTSLDAQEKMHKEMRDLETKFGGTADAVVSGDEVTRSVTSLDNDYESEDFDNQVTESEKELQDSDEVFLLAQSVEAVSFEAVSEGTQHRDEQQQSILDSDSLKESEQFIETELINQDNSQLNGQKTNESKYSEGKEIISSLGDAVPATSSEEKTSDIKYVGEMVEEKNKANEGNENEDVDLLDGEKKETQEKTVKNVEAQEKVQHIQKLKNLDTTFGDTVIAVVSDDETTEMVTDPDGDSFNEEANEEDYMETQAEQDKVYLLEMENEDTQEKSDTDDHKMIKLQSAFEDITVNANETVNRNKETESDSFSEESEEDDIEVNISEQKAKDSVTEYGKINTTFRDTIDAVVSEAENTKKVTDPGYIDANEDKEGKNAQVSESKDDTDVYLISMDEIKHVNWEKARMSQQKLVEENTEIPKTDEDEVVGLSSTITEENEKMAIDFLKKHDALHTTFRDTFDAVVSEAENTKKVTDPGYIDATKDKEGKNAQVSESEDDADVYLISMDEEKNEKWEKTRMSQQKQIEEATGIPKSEEDKEANLTLNNKEENEKKAMDFLKKYDALHTTFGNAIDAVVSEAEITKKVTDPGYNDMDEEEKDTHSRQTNEADKETHLYFIGMTEKENQEKTGESQQKMIEDDTGLRKEVVDKTINLLDKNEENEKEVTDTLKKHDELHASFGDTFGAAASKDENTEEVMDSSYIDTDGDFKEEKDAQKGEAEDKSVYVTGVKEGNHEKEVESKQNVEVLNTTFGDTVVAVVTEDENTDKTTDPTTVSYIDEVNEEHKPQANDVDIDERIHLLDYEDKVLDSTHAMREDSEEEEQEADMSITIEDELVKAFDSEEKEEIVMTDVTNNPHVISTGIRDSDGVKLKDESTVPTDEAPVRDVSDNNVDKMKDGNTIDMDQQEVSFKENEHFLSETFKDEDTNVEEPGISEAEPLSDLAADGTASQYSRTSDKFLEAVKVDAEEKPEEQTDSEDEQETEEKEEQKDSIIDSELHASPLNQVSTGSLISSDKDERQSKKNLADEMQEEEIVWEEEEESVKDENKSEPKEDYESWELPEDELLEDENALNATQNKVHVTESGHDKSYVGTTSPEKERVTDTVEIKPRMNIDEEDEAKANADMETEKNAEYTVEDKNIDKNGLPDKTDASDSIAEKYQSSKVKKQLISSDVKEEEESEIVSRNQLSSLPSNGDSDPGSRKSQESVLNETQDTITISAMEEEEDTILASALKNKSLDSSMKDIQDFPRTQDEVSQFSQDSGTRDGQSHPKEETSNEETGYSDSVKLLTILKAHFDDKHFEQFHKFLGLQNMLRVEAMFQDMETELKLVRKNGYSYEKTEEALDRIFESSESAILKAVEQVLDQRELQKEEIMEADKSMLDEESSLLDDFQELAYILRQKYSALSDSTPFAPGAQLPEKQSMPLESGVSERFAAPDNTVVSEQPLLKATPALPWIITALDSMILRAKENMRPYTETLVSALPEDMRPGPDFYGISWESVVVTALVGILSVVIFFWRTCLSVKSKMYQVTERQLSEKIIQLIQEKTEAVEQVSDYEKKLQEANEALEEAKKMKSSISSEAGELHETCIGLQEKNAQLQSEVKSLQTSLEVEKEHNLQQQNLILETQRSVENLKEVLALHSNELLEVQAALAGTRMSEDKIKSEFHAVLEENAQLKQSKDQLLKEAEGWSERHSELTEQIRLTQKAQKDLEESLAYKENEIEALTDCVMQLRQLDSESEAGNDDDSWEHSTEMANGELPEKKNEKLKLKIKQMMDVARMKTTLKIIEEERDNFQIKLSDEVTARHELEEQIKKLEHNTASVMSDKSHLENEFKTMQQRLEILTELYQQKEMALQKKLTQEEFQRQEKEQKLNVADEKAIQAVEEVKMYRQRIQEMEDELQKTERSYKNQIASHEKKAHENWLTARSAERTLVEQKRETANLRQKLIEVNQKIAELQRPSIIRPTPGRPDRQIAAHRGPVSREGSFGPSPVSGGAPSPPLMMDGLGRPPSAPLPRREVPRDRGDLDAAPGTAGGPRTSSPSSALDEMVNPSSQGPPSFPGTPIMNSPASGAPVPPQAVAPPLTRFGPPLPKGQYGPRIPPPVRGLLPPLGPRDIPPRIMDLGPGPLPPPLLGPRDYPPVLPPGARDLPPGPLPPPPLRISPRDFPPGPRDYPPAPRDFPSGPRDYPPGPRDFPPGPRDFPPGPRDFPPGLRDFPPGPRDFPPGPRDSRDYPVGLPALRDYPAGHPPISHGTRDYPPPLQLRDIHSGPTPPPGVRDNPPGMPVVQKDCPPSSDIRR